jgi:hypothetical protein
MFLIPSAMTIQQILTFFTVCFVSQLCGHLNSWPLALSHIPLHTLPVQKPGMHIALLIMALEIGDISDALCNACLYIDLVSNEQRPVLLPEVTSLIIVPEHVF